MAEVLGAMASVVTLAGLFKTCLEAFDLIQSGRSQETDLKKLKLRLNIEKCRLYVWGESMGLTREPSIRRPIDTFRFPDVIREILENLFDLFHDSHRIQDKYGCKRLEGATDKAALLEQGGKASGPIRSLAASFSNFAVLPSQDASGNTMISKVVWVIHDRKKFSALVAEIKYLVDSLQGITGPCVPVAQQAGTIRHKIAGITDAETLSLIAEVCSDDHPDIADAATTKADTISMVSSERRNVAAWVEHVDPAQKDVEVERMSPEIENMNVTELKHYVLKVMAREKEREASSLPSSAAAGSSDIDSYGVSHNAMSRNLRANREKELAGEVAFLYNLPAKLHVESVHTTTPPRQASLPAASIAVSVNAQDGSVRIPPVESVLNDPASTNTDAMDLDDVKNARSIGKSSENMPDTINSSSTQITNPWTLSPEPTAANLKFTNTWSGYKLYGTVHAAPSFTNPWVKGAELPGADSRPPTTGTPYSAATTPCISMMHTSSVVPGSSLYTENEQSKKLTEALDGSRGMVQMGHSNQSDTYNPYLPRATQDSYSFPATPTASSYSLSTDYEGSVSGSVICDNTDRSSITSEGGYSYSQSTSSIIGTAPIPPAPQSMMTQFTSKVTSSTQKKHKCRVCDKRFTRPSSLQTHMYSHTGEKPFACEVEGCGRHFSVVSNLRRHRRTHKSEVSKESSPNL